MTRDELLSGYGRFYGAEHLAVTFTASNEGEEAKRVTTRGWDKTAPLADGDYGAAYVAGRGTSRNPAIVLRPSNLIVLECDTEQDLVRIDELDLPHTITVRSSKPYKRHYWFRPPPELEALPYVAFRFESGKLTADTGRYFLAPPAIHPSGAVYAFLPDHGPYEQQIATLPERIYRELAQRARAETTEVRDRLSDDPEAKIPEGQRADLIFRYACMLRRWGLTHHDLLEQVHAYNEARCQPPLPRSDIEIQVAGAMKKQGGQELNGNAPHQEDHEDSWLPVNLNTLPDQPPVQPTLGAVGIVYPGKRHVFSGPQESAKTLAAYAIGLEVVRSDGILILIDFEMGAWDCRNRLRELGATTADFDRIRYIEPGEPANVATVPKLLDLQPTLVIVDAAAGAFDLQGLDDNKRQDVEKFTRLYVRSFWKAGVATIVLDHVVKDREARGKYAVGSERKVGGADVHLGFEVLVPISRGSSGLYKIVTHKDRGGFLKRGTLANMQLESHPATHEITWQFNHAQASEDEFRPTHLMEKVSEYIAAAGEGTTRYHIERGKLGKAEYVRQAILALIAEGYVTSRPGPRDSEVLTSTSPYTEKDDPKLTKPHLVPTSSPPRPDAVIPPRPTSSPPTGGRDGVTAEDEDTTSSRNDWVDELAPTPPDDWNLDA